MVRHPPVDPQAYPLQPPRSRHEGKGGPQEPQPAHPGGGREGELLGGNRKQII